MRDERGPYSVCATGARFSTSGTTVGRGLRIHNLFAGGTSTLLPVVNLGVLERSNAPPRRRRPLWPTPQRRRGVASDLTGCVAHHGCSTQASDGIEGTNKPELAGGTPRLAWWTSVARGVATSAAPRDRRTMWTTAGGSLSTARGTPRLEWWTSGERGVATRVAPRGRHPVWTTAPRSRLLLPARQRMEW